SYDLVIRVNPDPDERLVGRVLVRDRLVAVAHPNLPLPAQGETAPAVFRPSGVATTWDLVTPRGEMHVAVDPVLRLGALTMVRDAVRAGTGAALLPFSLVADDLRDGALVSWGHA
ncbi:LysR substrate-binding domain-containing protein, partial [Stenotrophomonas indicatrix]|uniref:LysR substrate-binding domain-containing protein n=1 Tax=Stenotrophomonas indicatrix TaxID=2045451 RepID=UPI002FD98E8E